MITEPTSSQLAKFADGMGRKLAQGGIPPHLSAIPFISMRDELLKISAFNPLSTGIGAGMGAIGGALTGAQRDQQGQTHMFRNALGGAAMGGAVGAAAGHFTPTAAVAGASHAPVPHVQPQMPHVNYTETGNYVAARNAERMASLSPEAHHALDNHPAVLAGMPKEMAVNLISMSRAKKGIPNLDHAVKVMAGPQEQVASLAARGEMATRASLPGLQKAAEDKPKLTMNPEVLRAAFKATAAMTIGGGIGYAGGKLLGKGIGTLAEKMTGQPLNSPNIAPYLAAGTALLGGALMAAESARNKQFKEVLHDANQRSEKQRRAGNVG